MNDKDQQYIGPLDLAASNEEYIANLERLLDESDKKMERREKRIRGLRISLRETQVALKSAQTVGSLHMTRTIEVYKELADLKASNAELVRQYIELEDYAARLLDRLTGGRISIPFTEIWAVESEVNEYYEKEHREQIKWYEAEITRLKTGEDSLD